MQMPRSPSEWTQRQKELEQEQRLIAAFASGASLGDAAEFRKLKERIDQDIANLEVDRERALGEGRANVLPQQIVDDLKAFRVGVERRLEQLGSGQQHDNAEVQAEFRKIERRDRSSIWQQIVVAVVLGLLLTFLGWFLGRSWPPAQAVHPNFHGTPTHSSTISPTPNHQPGKP